MSLRALYFRAAGVCAGCALILGAAPATAAELTFRFDGRGFGHGVGMSQWGAYGLAKQGWSAERIVLHYFTGVTLETRPSRPVRVRLNGGPSSAAVTVTSIGAAGAAYALPSTIPIPMTAGALYTARYVGGSVRLEGPGGTALGTSAMGVRFVPGGDVLDVGARNIRYAGSVSTIPEGGGLSVVNTLDRERYLRGVVPEESIASWGADGPAALEAQAIAARSYVESRRSTSRTWDVRNDQGDQVYGGQSAEDLRTNAAVAATADQVLTYGGNPINAMYASSSGGYTEDYSTVFGSDVPYLKGVRDPYDSPTGPWTSPKTFSASTLGAKLGLGAPVATIDVTARGASPRARTVRVVTTTGVTRDFTGWQVRGALDLRDSWFWITRSDQATPTPEPPLPADAGATPVKVPAKAKPSEVVRRGRWMVAVVRTPRRAVAAATAARVRSARPRRVMFRVANGRRSMYIVAVGRFADRADAKRERSRLRRLRFPATAVVAARPGYPAVRNAPVARPRRAAPAAPLNPTSVPAPAQQGRFRVVVADVATAAEAAAVARRLKGHLPAPRVLSHWTAVSGTRYVVVTLTAGNAGRAATERAVLAAKGFTGVRVEPVPAS